MAVAVVVMAMFVKTMVAVIRKKLLFFVEIENARVMAVAAGVAVMVVAAVV